MIIIINFGSLKTPFIAECVSRCGFTSQVISWDEVSKKQIVSSRAVIFSGSPAYLTEISHAPYNDKFGFIRETNLPILGICFGHQLIGVLNGGIIFRGEAERDETMIKVLNDDVLFSGLGRKFTMRQDHTEGITLPPGFIHLASSGKYPVEAMKHQHKKIWGVQFHPEVSGENGMKIFQNFLGTV